MYVFSCTSLQSHFSAETEILQYFSLKKGQALSSLLGVHCLHVNAENAGDPYSRIRFLVSGMERTSWFSPTDYLSLLVSFSHVARQWSSLRAEVYLLRQFPDHWVFPYCAQQLFGNFGVLRNPRFWGEASILELLFLAAGETFGHVYLDYSLAQ